MILTRRSRHKGDPARSPLCYGAECPGGANPAAAVAPGAGGLGAAGGVAWTGGIGAVGPATVYPVIGGCALGRFPERVTSTTANTTSAMSTTATMIAAGSHSCQDLSLPAAISVWALEIYVSIQGVCAAMPYSPATYKNHPCPSKEVTALPRVLREGAHSPPRTPLGGKPSGATNRRAGRREGEPGSGTPAGRR